MKRTLLVVTAALAAALAVPAANAADETAAMRVVRDKETGKLRAPNSDELREMLEAEKADRKARGLPEESSSQPAEVRVYANGMKAIVLGEEQLVSVIAERDADGNLVVRHANPADEHVQVPTADQRPTE